MGCLLSNCISKSVVWQVCLVFAQPLSLSLAVKRLWSDSFVTQQPQFICCQTSPPLISHCGKVVFFMRCHRKFACKATPPHSPPLQPSSPFEVPAIRGSRCSSSPAQRRMSPAQSAALTQWQSSGSARDPSSVNIHLGLTRGSLMLSLSEGALIH